VRSTTIVDVSWPAQISLISFGAPVSAIRLPTLRVLQTRQCVLVFDVVRLLAPVPWLSGRASASHAEGRWFDPSRDHTFDLYEHGACTLWLVGFVRFLSVVIR
jgi:hypothetical protein